MLNCEDAVKKFGDMEGFAHAFGKKCKELKAAFQKFKAIMEKCESTFNKEGSSRRAKDVIFKAGKCAQGISKLIDELSALEKDAGEVGNFFTKDIAELKSSIQRAIHQASHGTYSHHWMG
ncbi:MAG: hypothetical protein Q4D57_00810 [Clostridia bacterium]|nr:hypothetical protein [Clostridia bacterium]